MLFAKCHKGCIRKNEYPICFFKTLFATVSDAEHRHVTTACKAVPTASLMVLDYSSIDTTNKYLGDVSFL